jgi:hypothetical protein
MMIRTRGAVAMVVMVGVLGSIAVPGYAQDLDEWLDRAADAEFEGRQVTICNTPDGRLSDVVDVAQKDGMVAVGAPEGPVVFRSATVDPGGVGAVSGGSTESGPAESGRADLAARYSVSVRADATFMERSVDVVDVLDGDRVRVSYLFDEETGAVLHSEVRHADGSSYCTTQFIEFRTRTDLAADAPADGQAEASDGLGLPARLADFIRLDLYTGPNGSTAGFYSDGVFSFTIITADRRIEVAEMRNAPEATIDGHDYARRYSAGQVVYEWESKQGGYVLIGDLPPDLHGEVLADLPAPGKPSFIVRMWRRIFR